MFGAFAALFRRIAKMFSYEMSTLLIEGGVAFLDRGEVQFEYTDLVGFFCFVAIEHFRLG